MSIVDHRVRDLSSWRQPKSWNTFRVGLMAAIPNQLMDYFDLDWTRGVIEEVVIRSITEQGSNAVKVKISAQTSVWIMKLKNIKLKPKKRI